MTGLPSLWLQDFELHVTHRDTAVESTFLHSLYTQNPAAFYIVWYLKDVFPV